MRGGGGGGLCARLELLLVGEEGVEDGDAARDHRHLELVPLLKIGEALLEDVSRECLGSV